jgi:type IV pilus assembly protein PilM
MPIDHPTEKTLGIDLSERTVYACALTVQKGKLMVQPVQSDQLQPLAKTHQVVTGMDQTLLIRHLNLPIVKKQALESSLPLQLESILPYPVEEAVIESIILDKNAKETFLNAIAVKKEALLHHLELCKEHGIDPEVVSITPLAITQFTHFIKKTAEPRFTLHLRDKITLVASAGELLIASFTTDDPKEVKKGLLSIKKRVPYTFEKEIFTIGTKYLEELRLEHPLELYENLELTPYALSIGYALTALPNKINVNLLKGELAYKKPFKRLKKTFLLYFTAIGALSAGAYLCGESYLTYRQDEVKKHLAEALYQKVDTGKEISQLSLDELEKEILAWQKNIQTTPNLFALHPNIPRVSDLLAFLSTHPVAGKVELLQLSYALVKKPELTRKEDKYQVKVELEFTTDTPRLAREFHDALIAPNEFVDPKGEIKWSTSKGSYKTSFYLKDKTFYP